MSACRTTLCRIALFNFKLSSDSSRLQTFRAVVDISRDDFRYSNKVSLCRFDANASSNALPELILDLW